jgi:hypothetical protein
MVEPLTRGSKHVDARPVRLAPRDRLGVPPLLDAPVPSHGHWGGLRLGWVSVRW